MMCPFGRRSQEVPPVFHSMLIQRIVLCGALAVVGVAAPPVASADPPAVHLELRNTDGSSMSYLLSEIRNLHVDGTDLIVDLRSGSSSTHGFASLRSLRTEAAVTSVNPGPGAGSFETVRLLQSLPNPTTRGTRIRFDLAIRGRVALEIYEVSGRRIRTLVDKDLAAGRHEVDWDGADAHGRRASAGVYFYRLKGIGADQSRRVVVMP